jgi:predicted GH43/DUF377 family glycosyl hydrolase
MRLLVCAAAILLAGCQRYGDFTLPPLPASDSEVKVRWAVHPEPVLTRGAPGAWDGVDALNPSVVRHEGLYWNFYSGYDGRTWHTGVATSPGGFVWQKRGRVLSPDQPWEGSYIAANGSALRVGGEFLYWYQANRVPGIALARSRDGSVWTKSSGFVLQKGPRGSWDERGAADPYVIQLNKSFYMYYLGQDRARRQRLGLARSADGINWQKLRQPVMELGGPGDWDEVGLGEPAVWQSEGSYWMLYTGRDRHEVRRTGLARSHDGVHWRRISGSVLEGAQAWNNKVICDPAVEPSTHAVRVWFGGGNVPRPDENLNGQIGLATLTIETDSQ